MIWGSSRAKPPFWGWVNTSLLRNILGIGDQGRCAWGIWAFFHPPSQEVLMLNQMVFELMQLCSRGYKRKSWWQSYLKEPMPCFCLCGKGFHNNPPSQEVYTQFAWPGPSGRQSMSPGQAENMFALWETNHHQHTGQGAQKTNIPCFTRKKEKPWVLVRVFMWIPRPNGMNVAFLPNAVKGQDGTFQQAQQGYWTFQFDKGYCKCIC